MKIAILCLALVLVGCGTCEPLVRVEVQEVKVPVYDPPKVDVPQAPKLPIAAIGDASSDKEVAASYAATVVVLKAYVKDLLDTINVFKTGEVK